MRLPVFQHIDCEHPGSLRQFLADDGVIWDAAPVYYDALMASVGEDGFVAMKTGSEANMSDFTECAEKIYRNFMTQVSTQ